MEQSLEAPENGSLYIDAYSTSATVTVSSDSSGSGGSAQVEAVAVGGEFFYFHPLQLRSGAYISSDDLMDDLVVLMRRLAWRLFGGVELEGMTITLNGKPFVVAGVVSRENDFATKKLTAEKRGCLCLTQHSSGWMRRPPSAAMRSSCPTLSPILPWASCRRRSPS